MPKRIRISYQKCLCVCVRVSVYPLRTYTLVPKFTASWRKITLNNVSNSVRQWMRN